MFFQVFRVGLDRCSVEEENLWVFLKLDFLESIDRLCRRFREIGEALNGVPVHFGDDDIFEIFIAERIWCGEHLGEDDNAAPVGWEFVLEGVVVNKTLRRVGCPFTSPFFQVGPRKLDEHKSTEDHIFWGFLGKVRLADRLLAVCDSHHDGNLKHLAVAQDFEWHNGSGVFDRICEMAEKDASVVRVLVVAILVEWHPVHREDGIAFLDACHIGGAAWCNVCDIDAAGFLEADVAAKLWVSQRGEDDAESGKTLVCGRVKLRQKMANHRGRNDVGGLVASIVAHDHADESPVAHRWQSEAAVPLLEGCPEFEEEEGS